MGPAQSLFDSKAVRSAFVSKVYAILFVQLLVASIMIAAFTFHQPTQVYFKQHGDAYLFGALGVGVITMLVLTCVESARRSYPLNFILLIVVTLAYGLIAAVMSSRFETETVLCAFGATALATFVVMLLAKYSSLDMTTCGCALCVLALIHLVVSMILIILLPSKTTALIVAGAGAFLVSLYMMFDLQLIMGGRSMELSPEEYILGAVMLYIDILNLFQYMLILFAGSRD